MLLLLFVFVFLLFAFSFLCLIFPRVGKEEKGGKMREKRKQENPSGIRKWLVKKEEEREKKRENEKYEREERKRKFQKKMKIFGKGS